MIKLNEDNILKVNNILNYLILNIDDIFESDDVFDDVVKEMVKLNLEDLAKYTNKNLPKNLLYKIKKYSEKFSYYFSNEQLIEEFKSNEVVRSFFIKDPKKQNIYEIALEIIVNKFLDKYDINKKIKFEKLPNNGFNSLFLNSSGEIMPGNKILAKDKNTKSIDFVLKNTNGENYFINYKYTKDSGGHQDNQLESVKAFLLNAKKNHDKNVFFIAILDGNFYKNIGHNEIDYNTINSKIFNFKEFIKWLIDNL